jgi:hypothetical protein
MLSTKLKEAAGNSADATLYVNDVFSTYLYTGNGSTQTINNGIDLAGKGGLVWIKTRNGTYGHRLYDTIRTATKFLGTQDANAESTQANGLTAFTSSGFSVGANANENWSNANMVSWTFRKAAKFFDVVTYTGTGSARTIAHSLGVAPGMVIVKRTDTTGNWQVYSNGLTSAAYSIQLNLTNAEALAPTVWNSTAPTSSVFSVGTDSTVNASGGTYVAYLYAHDTSSTGIIQCGSFTTNGSAGATVNLGWEPQYILMKTTDLTDNWYVFDTMRGFAQTSSMALYPNLSNAEGQFGSGTVVPTATGFNINLSVGGAYYNNKTFIYMAIRRPNKPPTSGTQVFSPIVSSAATGTINTTGFVIDTQIQYVSGNSTNSTIADRLRGCSTNAGPNSTRLLTSSTIAEPTTSTWVSLYWNNTGFQNTSSFAGSSARYYSFNRAPGFFDVVCYTGTGGATTQAHNLTVAPELMIVKKRNSAINSYWNVYSKSLLASEGMYLNTTDGGFGVGSVVWNSTRPTSSVFSLGYDSGVNGSGDTYVAYLFATLAGISKVGSYTGNGTGQAIACGFSAGARFVLIKRTDSTGGWYTFDSVSGLTSGSSPYILLNSNATPVTGNNGVYASTGGFTLGSTASTTTNINAATYIFLAVA